LWAQLLVLQQSENLTVGLIEGAQLLVSQQEKDWIVAPFTAVGNFVSRFDHPIKPHRNVGESLSYNQLPSG